MWNVAVDAGDAFDEGRQGDTSGGCLQASICGSHVAHRKCGRASVVQTRAKARSAADSCRRRGSLCGSTRTTGVQLFGFFLLNCLAYIDAVQLPVYNGAELESWDCQSDCGVECNYIASAECFAGGYDPGQLTEAEEEIDFGTLSTLLEQAKGDEFYRVCDGLSHLLAELSQGVQKSDCPRTVRATPGTEVHFMREVSLRSEPVQHHSGVGSPAQHDCSGRSGVSSCASQGRRGLCLEPLEIDVHKGSLFPIPEGNNSEDLVSNAGLLSEGMVQGKQGSCSGLCGKPTETAHLSGSTVISLEALLEFDYGSAKQSDCRVCGVDTVIRDLIPWSLSGMKSSFKWLPDLRPATRQALCHIEMWQQQEFQGLVLYVDGSYCQRSQEAG